MKKIITFLVAVCAFATTAFPQDVRLSSVPETISVKTLAVRPIGNEDNNWRMGVGFPVMNFSNGTVAGYPSIATLDAWVLTDTRDMRTLRLGGGLDFPILSRKHMRLGVTMGWFGDFSDLEHVQDCKWSAGATLTLRF